VKLLTRDALGLHDRDDLSRWMTSLYVERRFTDHQSYLPGSQITRTRADAYHAGLRPHQSAAYSIAEPIETGLTGFGAAKT
jgi:hypothetical protein